MRQSLSAKEALEWKHVILERVEHTEDREVRFLDLFQVVQWKMRAVFDLTDMPIWWVHVDSRKEDVIKYLVWNRVSEIITLDAFRWVFLWESSGLILACWEEMRRSSNPSEWIVSTGRQIPVEWIKFYSLKGGEVFFQNGISVSRYNCRAKQLS